LGTRTAVGIPPFVDITGQVVAGDDGRPVANVLVRTSGQFGAGFEFTTASTTPTGDDGIFELRVPDVEAASLNLDLEPQAESPFASRQFPGLDLEDLTFRLEKKPRLRGTVAGRDGIERVASATISAQPVSEGTIFSASSLVSTTSDSMGTFELSLEPGTYDLTVQPPVSTGLPLRTERLVVDANQEMTNEFVLGRTSVVYGRVMASLEEPIAGARVEIFAHDADNGTAVLLGSGITDDKGAYRVIVPNPDHFDWFGLNNGEF